MKADIDRLPEVITAPRTDAVYNCHAYLTKVPIAAIRPFIEAFTSPGEVVADPFAGSGMTGLAAAILARKAELSDISVLGQHIANGYLTGVDAETLRHSAAQVSTAAKAALSNLYMTRRASDGAHVEMVRTVWSFTYRCPSCKAELVYFEHLRNDGTAAPDICPKCRVPFIRRNWSRGEDVPVQVVVRAPNGRLIEQGVDTLDLKTIRVAKADPRQGEIPSLRIDDSREMFSRSGLGKAGLTETAQFFSARNAIALLELWRAVQGVKDKNLRKKLSFAFTAILPRASRRYQWSAQRPLNAQNQTYYIAPVYYEWNVFELFQRKIEAAIRADDDIYSGAPLFFGDARNVIYTLASAHDLHHLAEASVDYVFTDPPFGSNIFYSDMNLFHEAWLGSVTDHEREAVMHTTGRKKAGAADRYQDLLRGAFSEAFRVLKPGRYMSVVFGNSNGQIWGLVQRAIRDAGFRSVPVHVAILDKGQRSVKGLNSGSEGVVTVDLVVTLRKPASVAEARDDKELQQADVGKLINAAMKKLPEGTRNPSHVYAAILRDAIRRHEMVDHLHLSDVLIALRKAGYSIDSKTGLLTKANTSVAEAAE